MQLVSSCGFRLCLASGHFPSERFLVIISNVVHSIGLALGGVMRQL